jgi:glutathione S-transferase
MAIKLYYAPGACSFASHIALEELGVPYETQKMNLMEGDQKKPEYLRINPRGRVPTLVVDSEVLTENVGILTYLGGGHPQAGIWPKKTWDQAKLVSTLAWLSNTVHPAYAHIVRTERYATTDAGKEDVKAKARENYQGYLEEIDKLLEGHKWSIANQYTVADGYLLVFYRWANRQKMPVQELKNYTALVQRVMARPAVKKVMADEGITLES